MYHIQLYELGHYMEYVFSVVKYHGMYLYTV